jgi:uncharacterized membrane protein
MKKFLRSLESPPRAFAALAILFGVPMIFLFPPFQGPDEQHHFYRAYHISEGHLGGEGNTISPPASLPEIQSHYTRLPFHPEIKISSELLWNDLSIPLAPDERREVECRSGAYAPVAYPGQVVGILLGRLLHLPALMVLYLARLCGFLLSITIMFIAILRTPAFRRVLFVLAFLPMTLAQLVVVSGDGMLMSWSFFLFAELMRGIYDDEAKIDRGFIARVAVAAGLITLVKPMYLAPLLLLLAVPPKKAGGWKRLLVIFGAIGLGAVLLEMGWLSTLGGGGGSAAPAGDASQHYGTQHDVVFGHPLHFIFVMLHNFTYKGFWYMETFIGQPGWLDVHLPPPAIYIFFFALTLACLTADTPASVAVGRWPRLLAGSAFFATMTTFSYAMYLSYTAVASEWIEGIQGRYFLPLVPTAAVVLATRKLRIDADPKSIWRAVYAYCGAGAALLVYCVADRYFGL